MSSKNLQEYVAERVIKHMEYRDEEVRKLRKLLKTFDIILCDFCHDYDHNNGICEICEFRGCVRCIDTYINTRNFATNMCRKCAKKTFCSKCLSFREYCECKERAS